MSKPVIVIVGGLSADESTLLNAIAGDTIFIVKDTPEVIKDRIYVDCNWLNMNFTLTDTGGIGPDTRDVIPPQMREQTEITISTADVITFIMNVRQGLMDSDTKVVDMLYKSHKPVVLTVDKVGSVVRFGSNALKFYNLGVSDPVPAPATLRLGIGGLLDEVVKYFDGAQVEEEDDDRPRIVVMGKPNVGKSSIINKLSRENRVIVNDTVSTARDAVNTRTIHNDTLYVPIDTVELHRKNKIKEELERYSIIHTAMAMGRAGIVATVIDTTGGVAEQGAKIVGIAHKRGKGVIVAANKWDVIGKTDKTIYEYTNKIKDILPFIPYVGYVLVSVQTGQRLSKLFESIDTVCQNQIPRVATGTLNKIMAEVVATQQPPPDKGERPKIYHMTQVAVRPPTFVVFMNDKELMHFSCTRYLENQIRNAFGFEGTSLKFTTRERRVKEQ